MFISVQFIRGLLKRFPNSLSIWKWDSLLLYKCNENVLHSFIYVFIFILEVALMGILLFAMILKLKVCS